ncbi:structural polyprotein [Porcine bastrovirus]|nr:structural polyprotein [Porcine bastrovirus]
MAPSKSKPAPPKRPQVTTQAKTQKDKQQDAQIQSQANSIKVLQREVKKIKTTGSLPVRERFSCRVNLGIINGSGSDAFCRRAHIFLNPALVKDIDASTETTPLSIKASQYTMYRIANIELRAHSLAGRGAISGTMVVLALQPDSSQGAAVSFDAVCTRKHVTGSVGDSITFKPKFTAGRDGWLYTNTSGGEANSTLGPSLEAFTFGKSTNLYQNSDYTGPLWRLTLNVTYEFTAYTPNPSLGSLGANTETHSMTVKTEENGDVVIETDNPVLGVGFSTGQPGIVDAIFSLIESGAGALGNIPVVGPLLQTGLAFLKPIFTPGADSVGNKHRYKVCGTFADARLGNAITVSSPINHSFTGDFRAQQLTAAELGGFGASPAAGIALPIMNLTNQDITCLTPNVTLRPAKYVEVKQAANRLKLRFNQPVYCRASAINGGTNTNIVQANVVYIPTTQDGAAFMLGESIRLGSNASSIDNVLCNVVYTDPEPTDSSAFLLATGDSIKRTVAQTGHWPLPLAQTIEYQRYGQTVNGTVGFTVLDEITPGDHGTFGPIFDRMVRPIRAAPFFGYHLMYVDYSTTPKCHAFYGALIVDANGYHAAVGCYLNALPGDVTSSTLTQKTENMNFAGRIIPSPQVWAAADSGQRSTIAEQEQQVLTGDNQPVNSAQLYTSDGGVRADRRLQFHDY